MPPRTAFPDAGRGRGGRGGGRGGERGGRGVSRGGDRGGWRGSGRGGFRGGSDRGSGRGRADSAARGWGARARGGALPAGGPPLSAGPEPALPAAHVEAIGVKRPGYGNAGRPIRLRSNHVAVKLSQGNLYQYDVVILPPNDKRKIEKNVEIINALQTQVEDRLSAQPGVYDGRKNLFTSFDLEFENGAREYVVPLGSPSPVEGGRPRQEFTVRLTQVASINPEVLQRFVRGEQSHDNSVLTAIMALNVVIRMEPSMRYPYNKKSFFTDHETRTIGGGMVLWRGYFQSVRPSIDRILINLDISTGPMYRPGKLIDLALEFLERPGSPEVLAPLHGLPDRERVRLQQFIKGLKITTSYHTVDPNRRRLVYGLTRESARTRRFEIEGGETMTVMEYYQDQLNIQLQYPDLICVELSTKAVIPLELCAVPPGQLVRRQIPQNKIRSILEFSTMPPHEREARIRNGLTVLRYGQSDYIRQFGMEISNDLVELNARIIRAPTLKYHPESRQPSVPPGTGVWNMIEKRMFKPVQVPHWIVIIYENFRRFNERTADEMVSGLEKACGKVGININRRPALIRRENGQGIIAHQLRRACEECQRVSNAPPTLIVAILPDGGNDIYTAIKHFGDVSAGISTQCMKAAKCYRAREQYYANITLKINVKLGGTNLILDPQDVSFLTDPANPTMVIGADLTHPPPGSRGRPSFTSLVGSVDAHGSKYVSRIGVQDSHRELIEDMENMCLHIFEQYKASMGTFPKRILLYRDGVSEGEFSSIINEELRLVRSASEKLGFNPTITLVIVGKYHKVVFFPTNPMQADRSGNCPAGTVIDTDVVSPVEWDYYLCSHSGLLGTSRPAHYNVLLDENNFTPDGLQSLSFALCHVYARCTRSVSVPAPVYYAHNVCERAKNHYDPQQGRQLFDSDIVTDTTGPEGAGPNPENQFQNGFRQAHERMAKTMYFC